MDAQRLEIYLDCNATTPVLDVARRAAQCAMAEEFGNPSSVHSSGLRARALIDEARARARRVLGAPNGRLLFLSGATEGIQTAVLSALNFWREQRDAGQSVPPLLLYGATDHKAVPEALKHWNALLGLKLQMEAIPVGEDGRHDLAWLARHAPQAALVCTMAANNETGVVSDLDGIAAALRGGPALWMVDGVQALGKLPLRLEERRIDYAPFSGHKLYAPKGIGMLYVREGAPFTPLLAGGGQEDAQRSGTENMSGIAAFSAVLKALEAGGTFASGEQMQVWRDRLVSALREAFPHIVFNAPLAHTLPTTLNFSVPGIASKVLLDLFDAAGIRVSGGSACSAAAAKPSYVLEAMGLPAQQTRSAVRLSFGPCVDGAFIDEACARIRACGESLRDSCWCPSERSHALPSDGMTRLVVDGAVCYLLADAASRRCVVIDPLPELTGRIADWIACQDMRLAAVLDTHSHGDHASSAAQLIAAVGERAECDAARDGLGWPQGLSAIELGTQRLTRVPIPGHTEDSTAYLLHQGEALQFAFVGDTVMPGALGRSDFPQSAPMAFAHSLKVLHDLVGEDTLMLPGHDYDDRFACTFATETAAQSLLDGVLAGRLDAAGFAKAKAALEADLGETPYQTLACGARVDASPCGTSVAVDAEALAKLAAQAPGLRWVDVREPYECRLGAPVLPRTAAPVEPQVVALSALPNALAGWLALPAATPVVFFCRSGNRSTQAAQALRRLGHTQAWSLAGGLALLPRESEPDMQPLTAAA